MAFTAAQAAQKAIWRLKGVVWNESGGLAYLSSGVGQRVVPVAGNCEQYAESPDWHCEVDGELVTPWSGSVGGNILSGGVDYAAESLQSSGARRPEAGGERDVKGGGAVPVGDGAKRNLWQPDPVGDSHNLSIKWR